MDNPNILIAIPAYNEELTIGSVVTLSKQYGDVLVVDDGSNDRTYKIAKDSGAYVIRHERNMGKGRALKTAFEYAAKNSYDIVVTIDADGQHNPDEIPLLLQPILNGEADLVIGSRFLNGAKKNIPFYRRIGLWILNTTTKLYLNGNVTVTDSQSGFRALNRKALEEVLDLESDGYNIESDMINHLSEKGIRITEAPITVRYDVPNKHKKHPLAHGLAVLSRIVSLIGYSRPLLLFGFISLVTILVASFLGYSALRIYNSTGHWPITSTIVSILLALFSLQSLIAGLVLNVLVNNMKKQ